MISRIFKPLSKIMEIKWVADVKERLMKLSKRGLSNNEIAGAVAVGNLVGFIPLFGTHTIVAIGLAHFFRLNTFIVILGSQISNPVSYPFQLFLTAEIGSLMLNGRFLEISFSTDIEYYLNHFVPPIMLGSLVLGAAFSGLSFLLVRAFLGRKKTLRQNESA